MSNNNNWSPLDIAVVGMACMVPGANNIDEFWENIKNGVESIHFFSDEELRKAGVREEELKDPNYIKATGYLKDADKFDAEFFNFSPSEAEALDPQRRIFLECGWKALENSGYAPQNYDGEIGVYSGIGYNMYGTNNVFSDLDDIENGGVMQFFINSDKDYCSTALSYKLNLTGPSMNIQTACSSALVAVHMARLALLTGECDMAIVGGSSLDVSWNCGYKYIKGSILSKTGHCRAFDAESEGTVFGSGCGVVVLKKLENAIEDHDNIHAIIKGSAINNDGSQKIGFTAPSVEGQSKVVVTALANSDCNAETISYIETHGTGTELGDPIEVESLTQAFNEYTSKKQFCAIGSVKPNIGHLNAAAGIVGFIKTVLCLEHEMLPPLVNYEAPNPKIDFKNSPFYINTKLKKWESDTGVLRAGVSSLGVGGTNAHVILQNFSSEHKAERDIYENEIYSIPVSAKSEHALDEYLNNLKNYLIENRDKIKLKDIAFTMQCGRNHFEKRRVVVGRSVSDIIENISQGEFLEKDKNISNTLESSQIRLAMLWINEEDVDWNQLYEDKEVFRIPLPTYPFENKSYWIEPKKDKSIKNKEFEVASKKQDISDWFYVPSWNNEPLPFEKSERKKHCRILFLDNYNVVDQISKKVKQLGDDIIVVNVSNDFKNHGDFVYSIRSNEPDDYVKLIEDLTKEGKEFDSAIFGLGITDNSIWEENDSQQDIFNKVQELVYYTLLYYIQALNKCGITRKEGIIFLTNNMFNITGVEKHQPEKITISSICKITQQEYLNIKCKVIDIVLEDNKERMDMLLEELVKDIDFDNSDMVIAYRNSLRWVQTYKSIRVGEVENNNVLEEGDTALISGGLIGLPYLLTEFLSIKKKMKLLLLEERDFPNESEWESWNENHTEIDQVKRKINNFKKLKEQGAEIIVKNIDTSSIEGTRKIIEAAEKKLGKINMVFHCFGGYADDRIMDIKNTNKEVSTKNFDGIIYGFFMLDEIFKERKLKNRIIMTSISSFIGGPRFASYAASGGAIVNYANKINKSNKWSWQVQCWDSVDIEWLDAQNNDMAMIRDLMMERILPTTLTSDEAIEVLLRLFSNKQIQSVAISATDLLERYNRWVKLEELHNFDETEVIYKHDRPDNISAEYKKPNTIIEKRLTKIWGEVLKINDIGGDDNFFELGGNSLLAVQLMNNIRNEINIDLPTLSIIEHPTILELIEYMNGIEVVNNGKNN